MSDDTGSTAPRRPAPDPFYLAAAHELGLDPGQVLDGSMFIVSDENDRTLAGTNGSYRVTWQGIGYMTEETIDRLRTETRQADEESRLPDSLPLPRIDCHGRPMLWKVTSSGDEYSRETTLHCPVCHCVIRLDPEADYVLRRAAAAAGLKVIDFDFAAEHLGPNATPRVWMPPDR